MQEFETSSWKYVSKDLSCQFSQSTECLISALQSEFLSGVLKVGSCRSTWFNPCRGRRQVPIYSWQFCFSFLTYDPQMILNIRIAKCLPTIFCVVNVCSTPKYHSHISSWDAEKLFHAKKLNLSATSVKTLEMYQAGKKETTVVISTHRTSHSKLV